MGRDKRDKDRTEGGPVPYPRRTMEYPHQRGLAAGRDPVLTELLFNMQAAADDAELDSLCHMLCSSVWWLDVEDVGELWRWMIPKLENRKGRRSSESRLRPNPTGQAARTLFNVSAAP